MPMRTRLLARVAAMPLAVALSVALTSSPADAATDVVIAAAGDVACSVDEPEYNGGAGTIDHCHQRAPAGLINRMNPQKGLMLGDGQYNAGSLAEYQSSYAKTWGAFKAKTRPTLGNHDYGTSGARGYFSYFGAAAGSSPNGWYSFDIGAWHIVNLNTNCSRIS